MTTFLFRQKAVLIPLLLLCIITPFTQKWDLKISHHYYIPGQGIDGKGFNSPYPFTLLYTFGTLPALLTFFLSFIILIFSCFSLNWEKWKKPTLLLVLSFSIGSGLMTHAIFKDHWGRPRPKQLKEFGGTQDFRPYYLPNIFNQEPSKSFPSGHATMGFYFFSLALVGKRLHLKWLFWAGLIISFGLGGILSWTRIIQGAHFLTDTLISALIMWCSAYYCDRCLYARKSSNQ